jgi:hypothetical protein
MNHLPALMTIRQVARMFPRMTRPTLRPLALIRIFATSLKLSGDRSHAKNWTHAKRPTITAPRTCHDSGQFNDYDFVQRNLVTFFDSEETFMTRVALYARFSSDNQRDASIIDQIRACRLYAEKQGWTIVGNYQDRAVSGASLVRAGVQE